MPEGSGGNIFQFPDEKVSYSRQGNADGGPFDAAVEHALLGALLIKPRLLEALPPSFDREHYALSGHAEIHTAIAEYGTTETGALLIVKSKLSGMPPPAGDHSYLSRLVVAETGLSPDHIRSLAERITDLHRRRRLLVLGKRMQEAATSAAVTQSSDDIIGKSIADLDMLTIVHGERRGHVTFDAAMDQALADADLAAATSGITGVPTGMASVDAALGGMDNGTVTILAGRPSMGKTSLALGWCIHAAYRAKEHAEAIGEEPPGVEILSLEMPAPSLARRALSAAAQVPAMAIKRGDHHPHLGKLIHARRNLAGLPLDIDDAGGQTMAMVRLKCRHAARRHGGRLALIAIDHVQHIQQDNSSRVANGNWILSQISNGVLALAKEFNCPVLLLSQLSRALESREDKRPVLADLRESGTLEQDAQNVLFIYRHEYYLANEKEPQFQSGRSKANYSDELDKWHSDKSFWHGKAELIVGKCRDGVRGVTIPLRFEDTTISFHEPVIDQ